jgi:hypothetical protein
MPDGSTKTEVVITGHLRCSANAALNLKACIERALEMGQQSIESQSAVPEGKLN